MDYSAWINSYKHSEMYRDKVLMAMKLLLDYKRSLFNTRNLTKRAEYTNRSSFSADLRHAMGRMEEMGLVSVYEKRTHGYMYKREVSLDKLSKLVKNFEGLTK